MSRTADPLTPFRVFIQNDKQYKYASVTEVRYSKRKGIEKPTTVHLGTIVNNQFIPNASFRLMPVEKRIKYIFPDNIDLTLFHKMNDTSFVGDAGVSAAADQASGETNMNKEPESSSEVVSSPTNDSINTTPGEQNSASTKPSDNSGDQTNNRLYGSFWLLDQIARNCGLYDDLLETFQGNIAKTNEVLSLALFPYLSNRCYNRFAKWQRTHKTLLDYPLRSPAITLLTQSITNDERLSLINLRINRQPDGAHVDCDSTSRSAWGKCLADISWGNNKDNEKLQNTVEVVVYSLETHEPIYYRSFPGNTSDMSTIRTILADLKALKVGKGIVFILDRGYISEENLAAFIEAKIPFMMCAKVKNAPVATLLLEIEYDSVGIPTNMTYDTERRLYYCQKDIPEYDGKLSDGTPVKMKGMKANLFLNPRRRIDELSSLTVNIEDERKLLEEAVKKQYIPSNIKEYNATFTYFKVENNKDSKGNIIGIKYKECSEKISKEKSQCGFFGSVTYELDISGKEALDAYKSRDEHEKSWDQLKNQMGFYVQRNSSEAAKDGRSFIAFTGLIPISKLRNVWTESMYDVYESTYDMLDEMESIRFSEYSDGSTHMTTFTGKQVQICEACGVEVPYECLPKSYKDAYDRKKNPKKRGPKPKQQQSDQK